jgi:hypothetical protein
VSLLQRVVAVLEERQIPYALIGAAAMAAHGVSRSTFDIDFLTTDRRVLEPETWTIPDPVELRRGDADDPLAGVVRVSVTGEASIDVIVGRDQWQQRLLSATRRATLEGVSVPVVDAAGLILLKLFAGGPQDAWDIEQLLAASEPGVAAAVERGIADLPDHAGALWKRIVARPDESA